MTLWRHHYGDDAFRAALRNEILQHAAVTPSYPSHNRGGWRSDETVLNWPIPEVAQLRLFIEEAVRAAYIDWPAQRLVAWAVVNRNGSQHHRHLHSAALSGIYYLDGDPGSACTVFEFGKAEVRVTPEPGLMVLFPSRTWHSVELHRSSAPRITIAFDAQ